MINPVQLEESFNEFAKNLSHWVPDGVTTVNMKLLEELGLLNHHELDHTSADPVSHYFHVVETPEKVTLFNDQFAVWIVPKFTEEDASTMTYIALLVQQKPHLEIVFSTSGVYNAPKYILKVLQHFLTEVIDTEQVIASIGKKQTGS